MNANNQNIMLEAVVEYNSSDHCQNVKFPKWSIHFLRENIHTISIKMPMALENFFLERTFETKTKKKLTIESHGIIHAVYFA